MLCCLSLIGLVVCLLWCGSNLQSWWKWRAEGDRVMGVSVGVGGLWLGGLGGASAPHVCSQPATPFGDPFKCGISCGVGGGCRRRPSI